MIWLISVLKTSVIVVFSSGAAVANVNTNSGSFEHFSFFHFYTVLYLRYQPDINHLLSIKNRETFNEAILFFINLPLLICLVYELYKLWRDLEQLPALEIQGTLTDFKTTVALKSFSLFNIVWALHDFFFICTVEDFFSSHPIEHYIWRLSVMDQQHHIIVSMKS